jgi:hypothetical protein
MFPHERSLVTNLRDRPFVLLGVNTDQDREKILEVQRDGDVTWRSWWNGRPLMGQSRRITNLWQVETLPTLYLLDHKGIVQKCYFEVPNQRELDDHINRLVDAAERDGKPAS